MNTHPALVTKWIERLKGANPSEAELALLNASTQQLTVGVGFKGTNTLYYSGIQKFGDFYKTTIFIDLTDAKSTTTVLDIIGLSGVSHVGQITAAKNGTLFYGQITCLETPATGDPDIDFYYATAGTGAYDADVSALDGAVAMRTNGGSWSGAVATPIRLTAVPAADKYMYLAAGAGSVPAIYSAGQFLIELWGA